MASTATSSEISKINSAFQHDEASFRKSLPYEVTPTELKGVYLNPTPPPKFDLNTAKIQAPAMSLTSWMTRASHGRKSS